LRALGSFLARTVMTEVQDANADGDTLDRRATFGATAPLSYAGHRQPFPDRNNLCFPPRGKNRPTMRQIMSEPNLRAEFMGQTQLHAEDRREAEPERYHQGLEDIFAELDAGKAVLSKQKKREAEARRNYLRSIADQERLLASESVGHERTPWALTDKCMLDYFNDPIALLDKDISRTNSKNNVLMGIFDVKDERFRPAHHEFDVHGGWNNFKTNERDAKIDFFEDYLGNYLRVKDGADRPRKLGPTELPFREKLDRKLAKATDENHRDQMAKTCGYMKKQRIEENAEEFGALKRGKPPFDKPPWNDSKDPKLGYFSQPEPYVPGDHPYTTGMPKYVLTSDRALSSKRDYIAGDAERTSFWKAPKAGHQGGSSNMHAHAQDLVCPKGVKNILKWSRSKSNPTIDLNTVPGQLRKSVSGHLMKNSMGGSPCHKAVGAPRSTGSWKQPPRVAGSF